MSSDEKQERAAHGQAPKGALDAALSRIGRPTATADFRARLRETFVAGEFVGTAGNSVVTSETTTSQSEDVIDLDPILQAIEAPAARSAFKRELRERFVGAGVEQSTLAPHTAPKTAGVPHGARRQRRLTWAVGAGALVLAAALVITFVLRTPGQAQSAWQLRPIITEFASESAPVQFDVDGVAYVPGQDLGKADLIAAGSQPLRLQFSDQLVVDLEPGSSLDISGTRGTGDIVLAMAGERGGYRVATLGGFDSSQRRLLFQTPDAEVEVHGTVFGIDRYQDDKPGVSGTCICCSKGEVRVRARNGDEKTLVSEGKSSYVLASVGGISPMEMPEAHEGPLNRMAAQIY